MKVLLLFLGLVFFGTLRSARRGRPQRLWPLLLLVVIVSIGYLTRRVIDG